MLTVVTVHPILAAPLGHTVGSFIPTTRTQPRRYHCCGKYLSIGDADSGHCTSYTGCTTGSHSWLLHISQPPWHNLGNTCWEEYLSIASADSYHSLHPLLSAPLGSTVGSHIPTIWIQPRWYHCCGEHISFHIPTSKIQPKRYHCFEEHLSLACGVNSDHCIHSILAAPLNRSHSWLSYLNYLNQYPM